jgi:probable F420-dependent oxidoreductase
VSNALSFGLDVGVYGSLAKPDVVVDLAQHAESAGFDSIWLADHVAFPVTIESKYPYSPTGAFPVDPSLPLLEPIAAMGVLIGETERVRIGTAVLVMPYRNPVVLGRMLATYDVFSGGRIVLGAGVGWLEEEFEALDARDFADRGPVTDECIEIVKRICAGGEVAYDGEHYRFAPLYSVPASVQRPHVPIVIGGTSRRALARTARLGDGWLSVALRPEQLATCLERLRTACSENARRYEDLTLLHKIFLRIGEPKPGVDGQREPGTGSVAEIIDDLNRVQDLGYEGIIVRHIGDDHREQRDQISCFTDEIVPRL